MERQGKLVRGIIFGAGAMYLLDPDRGPRRRSLLRDRIVRAGNKLGDGLSATARDTKNRTVGAAASFRSRFRDEEVEDDVLQERVRSAIGRLVSHPGAIEVTAFDGRVTLRGDVLTEELNRLIKGVSRVRGVREVRNALASHASTDGVPALQGQGRPREQRPELLQENWAPAVRLAMGALGGWMAFKGLRTRGVLGRALSPIGLGLLIRAVTNRPTRRLVGVGGGRRALHIQKTIRVNAPVERVWELWSRFEQFPRFMSHLREVQRIDQNRSHWVASGPGGIPVEWDATVTEWLPHELIAWKSVEGSAVETAGRVQFRPMPDGQTEIDVHMSYNPPVGTLGHVVASLFGTDPKHAMDEDLVRLKSLLEDGKSRAEGESVGGKAGGFS